MDGLEWKGKRQTTRHELKPTVYMNPVRKISKKNVTLTGHQKWYALSNLRFAYATPCSIGSPSPPLIPDRWLLLNFHAVKPKLGQTLHHTQY